MSPQSQNKQIVIRPTGNDLVREFHIVGTTICDLPYAEFWNPTYGDAGKDFEVLGPQGREIAFSLISEETERKISQVKFRPQSVKIYLSTQTDWSTMERFVISKLQQALGSDFTPVQYGKAQYQREFAHA